MYRMDFVYKSILQVLTPSIDVWSYGCVVFELMECAMLFPLAPGSPRSTVRLVEEIKAVEHKLSLGRYDSGWGKVVRDCCKRCSKARPRFSPKDFEPWLRSRVCETKYMRI